MATAVKDALQVVAELGEAWNARNVEKIVVLFTEDGVWEASWGQQYAGKEDIRQGLAQLFGNVPDVRFIGAKRFASGDNVVSEWRVVGTGPDGTKIDEQGCDVYTLRGGKVLSKRAYRKALLWNRPA